MVSAAQARSLRTSADAFAALGDETRLHLVLRLGREGSLSITELTEGARISRQGVTKHLRVLGRAGLVRAARVGREQTWTLEAKRLAETRRTIDLISAEWDRTLERLRAFVEDDAQ